MAFAISPARGKPDAAYGIHRQHSPASRSLSWHGSVYTYGPRDRVHGVHVDDNTMREHRMHRRFNRRPQIIRKIRSNFDSGADALSYLRQVQWHEHSFARRIGKPFSGRLDP